MTSAPLLELSYRDEAEGLGDAPWPPHFAKQKGEPHRAAPSQVGRHRSQKRRPDAAGAPGSGPKTDVELGGHGHVELGVGARLGTAVRTPAPESGGVAEAVALEMVVGDLAHEDGVERLPAAGPCRRSSATAPPACARRASSLFELGPRRPGVPSSDSTAVGGELVDQLAAPGRGERGRDPDVVEDAGVVEEPEQQRPDHAARLVPAEPGHDAVGGAFVLDLRP